MEKQTESKQRKALTLRQKRNMVYFVEATEKILKEEGIPGVTIRRIAAEAGYNSATLYNYFQDLDELILFGSVCFLRDYLLDLSRNLQPEMTSLERYRTIYQCFNRQAFQFPEIFYNMFFGRYSAKLGRVIQTYYLDLFPEELQGLPADVREMVIRGTLVNGIRWSCRIWWKADSWPVTGLPKPWRSSWLSTAATSTGPAFWETARASRTGRTVSPYLRLCAGSRPSGVSSEKEKP